MGQERRIVPDFEVILCPPQESFRWTVHDYPHHLAKWHYHPEFELHLITEGGGEMMIGDYVGGFEPGVLVLTGPGVPHNWVSRLAPGERIENRDMLIQFTAAFADKVTGLCPEFESLATLFAEASRGLAFSGETAATGRRLLAAIGTASGAARVLLFIELMAALARDPAERRSLSRAVPAAGLDSRSPERIETAIAHIIDNIARPLSLTELAALSGMEATAFSRFFKRQTGHTFARYVNRMRVHAACDLLAKSDRPVTDICFEVGFNTIANFNRQFARLCGRSPSAYRPDAHRIGTGADPFSSNTARRSRAHASLAAVGLSPAPQNPE